MGRGGSIKRLVPAGKTPSKLRKPVTSLKVAKRLTGAFHALLSQREGAPKADAARLDAEIAAMGGREAYQEASALATKAFKSSRWVFKTLTRFGLAPSRGALPLRVLEIGATNAQLAVCPWLRVRAIDIRSCNPAVESKDFFDVPVGSGPTGTPEDVFPGRAAAGAGAGADAGALAGAGRRDRVWGASPCRLSVPNWDAAAPASEPAAASGRKRSRPYDDAQYGDAEWVPSVGWVRSRVRGAVPCVTGCFDVVVCSMVLNCVFEPAARTRMLVASRDHLVPGGILYFAVPSRCLDKSEFLSRAMLESLFSALGFAVRDRKETPKIAFYCLERVDVLPADRLQTPPPPPPRGGFACAAPSAAHGAGWRPHIFVGGNDAHAALVERLRDPSVKLSGKELAGLRGTSRTNFALAVPAEWLVT
jgi:hypothetical protein